jgi:Pentapeptide repeats (8 copies)
MFGTTKIKITLTTIFGTVLWESEKATIKEAVLEKYKRDANLYGADLRDANLYGADLRGANLYGADLYGADLRDADLRGADLRDANLYDADLRDADLRDADLYGANLRGANLYGAKNLPQSYINLCSRDILFVLEHLKPEVPYLREKLIKGEVDGSQYEGECACLIGSLGKADGGVAEVCKRIPFYEKGLENLGEQWFFQIRPGDTPKNSFFVKHAVELIDMVIGKKVKTSKKKAA